MAYKPKQTQKDIDPIELQEWLDSLEDILQRYDKDGARKLLKELQDAAYRRGVVLPFSANTPYINSIPADQQPRYPGNRDIERRIKSIIRWNAMATVVRANRECEGIGGHISTYASAATLLEVGFNHFFRGPGEDFSGDQIYFQGHAAPGIYARAFLEGRLSEELLKNFRRELSPGGGLSSYPHPWLMPSFWQFPTVSMGLGPIQAIYQARFNRYLEDRGIKDTSRSHVWCFIGDGETDEPETLGAISLAAREKLDNLIFVINCNLQRLDGPVRGNSKIIQELEADFRGTGWNVIKVIWGSDWDPLLTQDSNGLLVRRMNEVVDGQYQKYVVESGDYIRKHFFGAYPELLKMTELLSDEQLRKMNRGGHDPEKVYAAFKAAVEHTGSPTVILAKTIKGYGLGEAGEGRNISHQQKKLNEDELREFRTRFGIPISDEQVAQAPFYKPADDSPEIRYLHERRQSLGGYVPSRSTKPIPLKTPSLDIFAEFLKGSGGRDVSTTMAFVRMLGRLLRDPELTKLIVPIVPDEARTFGMEAMFRQYGIYSHCGQLYEPVDAETVLYYREVQNGQILEEGITEAGAMASFLAAATSYSNHGVNMIPFFIYYSMFGFQRIGDMIWAAGDMRAKGFLLGGTAGRTTLNGEGLQHQDGHSHLHASAIPNLMAYDPAYAYEIAVIVQDGIRRMYEAQESIFYYLTLYNENYEMPPMAEGVAEGILRGMYKLRSTDAGSTGLRPQLFGSGPILRQVLKAQDILAEKYSLSTDVWSVTSYKELRRDAQTADRWNRLHPDEPKRTCHLWKMLDGQRGPFIAASDYVRLVQEQIAPWIPGGLIALGTDGFGRSASRESLRRFFEVDAETIVLATLHALARRDESAEARPQITLDTVRQAMRDLNYDPNKPDPTIT